MSTTTTATSTMIVPCLRYDDAPAAIAWLAEAFGFEERMVVPGAPGKIDHAQLTLGPCVVMLGSTRADDPSLTSPRHLPACNQSLYVYIGDDPAALDAHFARATAAGARTLGPVSSTSYGSREYTARDPEGNLWTFGTYRPAT